MQSPGTVPEVFAAFLKLGLTSFGGPVAHLGYFRQEFVERRRWLSDADYAELVALCQFLPGPASSQVGMALGHLRAGWWGALAAFLAFTLPSVAILLAFGYGLAAFEGPLLAGAIHGLKIAALAVVAQAVWAMAKSLAPDARRRLVLIAAAALVLLVPHPLVQVAVIALAGVAGMLVPAPPVAAASPASGSRRLGAVLLALFVALLAGLPLLVIVTGDPMLAVAEKFYRAGSLVFGGGHVVLPLLESELVAPGLIGRDAFLAGYGMAQAVPGPLFSFAAYAGAMLNMPPNGLIGAALALCAIYLPSALLLFGALPYWNRLKSNARLRGGLDLANAAVVGLLAAVLYDPVFTSAVFGPADFALALVVGALLIVVRLPPWLVVVLSAAAGAAMAAL
jgi:chromate transporter